MLILMLLSQAKNKVGQAKSKSANATRQVEKALADVEAIIEELNHLPYIGKIQYYLFIVPCNGSCGSCHITATCDISEMVTYYWW
jgi:N-acetylglucosamine kinase-like BadF-type ATPase